MVSTPPIAYCVDTDGIGYDFDTRPEPEHAVEIFILRSTARTESCASKASEGELSLPSLAFAKSK